MYNYSPFAGDVAARRRGMAEVSVHRQARKKRDRLCLTTQPFVGESTTSNFFLIWTSKTEALEVNKTILCKLKAWVLVHDPGNPTKD